MSKYSALIKRASSATAALALTVASLTPAVMLGGSAKAGQMTERNISVSNSDTGESATYTVSFKTASATTIEAVFVDFCTDPIIGSACTQPNGLAVTSVSNQAIGNGGASFTGALYQTDRGAKLTSNSGESVTVGETISFSLTATNPSSTGTYYARILTYAADDATYVAATPGAYIDAGGVALSATEDVTINARVKETLTFCVGATDPGTASPVTVIDTCDDTDWDGSTVDLGVLDSADENTTPVPLGVNGDNRAAAFLLSTNAYYGSVVTYTSPNSLKVAGVAEADCEDDDDFVTDQCINVDLGGFDFASGAEKFGMSVTNVEDKEILDGESTLVATAPYGTSYAWNTTESDEIASTSSVVSKELATLTFKGQSAITTPSGFYTTYANFVATAKY